MRDQPIDCRTADQDRPVVRDRDRRRRERVAERIGDQPRSFSGPRRDERIGCPQINSRNRHVQVSARDDNSFDAHFSDLLRGLSTISFRLVRPEAARGQLRVANLRESLGEKQQAEVDYRNSIGLCLEELTPHPDEVEVLRTLIAATGPPICLPVN